MLMGFCYEKLRQKCLGFLCVVVEWRPTMKSQESEAGT